MYIVTLNNVLHVTKIYIYVEDTQRFTHTLGYDKNALHQVSAHKSLAQICTFVCRKVCIFTTFKQHSLYYMGNNFFQKMFHTHLNILCTLQIYRANRPIGLSGISLHFYYCSTRKMHTIVKVYSVTSTQFVHKSCNARHFSSTPSS